MHMGSLATIGQNGTKNLKHIIFNNGAHDSVGGQPTDAGKDSFSFTQIAKGCGYKDVTFY
jgi:phosphonopyruvate decarboxylase